MKGGSRWVAILGLALLETPRAAANPPPFFQVYVVSDQAAPADRLEQALRRCRQSVGVPPGRLPILHLPSTAPDALRLHLERIDGTWLVTCDCDMDGHPLAVLRTLGPFPASTSATELDSQADLAVHQATWRMGQHTSFLGAALGPNPDGLQVLSVEAGWAADAADLRPGDVVTRFGTHPIDSQTDLLALVRRQHVGDSVAVAARRGMQAVSITIHFTNGPPIPGDLDQTHIDDCWRRARAELPLLGIDHAPEVPYQVVPEGSPELQGAAGMYIRRHIYVAAYGRYWVTSLLAHELTHAWQDITTHHMPQSYLAEGLATWIQYHVMEDYGRADLARSMASGNGVHGQGLRWALELEKQQGRAAVITYDLSHDRIPNLDQAAASAPSDTMDFEPPGYENCIVAPLSQPTSPPGY